jgi:hypothetical protein
LPHSVPPTCAPFINTTVSTGDEEKVENTLPERFEGQLTPSALPPRPTVSKDLSWVFQEFDKEVEIHNRTHEILERVRQAVKKNSLDATLIILSPKWRSR